MIKRIASLAAACMLLLALCACGQSASAQLTWQEQYDLGVRYLSEGNYEEAILAFTAAIEIDPNRAEAYVGRGDAYLYSGDSRKNLRAAKADYERAIELDETLAAAYLGLAEVYVHQQKPEDALDILRQGADRAGDNEEILEKIDQMEQRVVDVQFTSHIDGDFEYAVISGVDATGEAKWTYTTPKYGMTELTRIEEIGQKNGMYYFNEGGTVITLDPNSGEVVWKNDEFGGAGICFASGDNGDLFLAGYYGPHFFWIDKNGKTIRRMETVDPRYLWPSEIRARDGYVEIVMNGTASDGYGEQHIVTVSLNENGGQNEPAWRQAYLTYVQEEYGAVLPDPQFEFQLIYVDNDEVPELWICSNVIATGSQICTFDGEQVNSMYISEYGSLEYIERSGLFRTDGGRMDVYWVGVYELRNGQFVELAHGDFGAEDNANVQFDENNLPIYQYSWNRIDMSEQEYADSLARAFDTSRAHNIFDDPSYDYYQLQQVLSEQ